MRASNGVTFLIGRQSKSVRVGDERSIFFAKIPLFHHRRIKVSLTLLISKLTRSPFIKQGQVFKASAGANH